MGNNDLLYEGLNQMPTEGIVRAIEELREFPELILMNGDVVEWHVGIGIYKR